MVNLSPGKYQPSIDCLHPRQWWQQYLVKPMNLDETICILSYGDRVGEENVNNFSSILHTRTFSISYLAVMNSLRYVCDCLTAETLFSILFKSKFSYYDETKEKSTCYTRSLSSCNETASHSKRYITLQVLYTHVKYTNKRHAVFSAYTIYIHAKPSTNSNGFFWFIAARNQNQFQPSNNNSYRTQVKRLVIQKQQQVMRL